MQKLSCVFVAAMKFHEKNQVKLKMLLFLEKELGLVSKKLTKSFYDNSKEKFLNFLFPINLICSSFLAMNAIMTNVFAKKKTLLESFQLSTSHRNMNRHFQAQSSQFKSS